MMLENVELLWRSEGVPNAVEDITVDFGLGIRTDQEIGGPAFVAGGAHLIVSHFAGRWGLELDPQRPVG
jgi:hypothetical protein